MANAMLVEDLQSLFDNKNCIEASLVSLSPVQDSVIMLEKAPSIKTAQDTDIINVTKTQYDKSVTSKANELAQFNDITYTYELVSEEGPPHNKNFKVVLTLGDENYEGAGTSLKKAQQAAAASAMENTFYEHPPIKIKEEIALTPTVVLNNIAAKLGIAVSYNLVTNKDEQAIASYDSSDEAYGKSKSYYSKLNSSTDYLRVPSEEPQQSGPFTVKLQVGDSVFVGLGHTIQGARHDAATKAIKNMEKEILYKDNVCSNEESMELCQQKRDGLKSPISRVYEAAQRRNLGVEFNIISESGKSHNKVFVTQCKLGDFTSEGEGKSKKESKRIAAENMLQNLPRVPEIYDGKNIINGLKNKKKKKKNKMRKNKHLGVSFGDVLSPFWGTAEAQHPNKVQLKSTIPSAKDKLLEIGNLLGVDVQFTDLNKYGGDFYTLVSLGVNPSYVCLGKASTREHCHDKAALHGLKFLSSTGALDKAGFAQYKEQSDYIEDAYLEEERAIYASLEDSEKSDP